MITVYGRATSSNVQAVMWCAAELGLEVERLDIGHVHGGNDTAEFLAMNPNGLVPVLKDGEVVLFENGAIVRYLAARYGDASFWPADPAVRGPLDVWAEWIKTTFAPAILPGLFYPLVRLDPATVTAAQVQAGAAAVNRLAAMLDARIGAGPWLAGDALTWADIQCGHLLYRYFELPFERPDLPALRAYYDRLCARPAYDTHVRVSYEPLRFKAK